MSPVVTDAESQLVNVLGQINERLGLLVSLSAAQFTTGLKQTAAIEKLALLGISARMIADVTGAPITTVAPTISRAKKGATPKRRSGER